MSTATADAQPPVTASVTRPVLDELDVPLGKRVRLRRLLYGRGLKNGTLLILPIDQGLEHGGRCFVLFSGGSKLGDDDLLTKVRTGLEAGATGLIFGRNMWQRPFDEALAITERVHELMKGFGA